MKKAILGVIAALFITTTLSSCGYNSMVKLDEDVKTKWNQVETQYQRRSDLIPNLVSTVKGAAKFEQGTLTAVIEARAQASQIKVSADDLTPEKLEKFQAAQGQIGQALGKLMVLTENYPELKATQQFSDLSVQLEGTENRIAVARKDFNDAVQSYNVKVRSFPNNLTAGMFGFKQRAGFKADAGAQNTPKVEF
ncbi:LemA protein [Pedobacter cryoconitis]|uniref:LemA family protein n=1 Tax=Pedobacter cryoconitis TaxID=188932 RepID=A0A127V6U2_9SPHI|nr:LemA family protein [Pedobacter cryoconitis]AMP96984.1 LemA family protein [Pedobacter cryoconitis]MBB5622797.1 LemA protein [Pedobacter cryoconitis]MBB5648988.1 LemA protein [Pedobacter cryoconitis]